MNDTLYKSGFSLGGLPLMFRLSGLVDIVDVLWTHDQVLYFIVRSKDKTGVLFSEEGSVVGQPLRGYKHIPQPTMVATRAQADQPWCLSGHGPQ